LLTRVERQQSILRGAAAAFAKAGFDGTSMEDVADASGITRLIVYRNFASKEDLYRAVLERVVTRLGEEFTDAESAVRPLLTVAREDPDAFRLLWAHAAHEPRFAAYVADFREAAVEFADELVGSLIADTRLRRWAMIVIVDHLYDAVLTWLDVGDPKRDNEFVAVTSSGLRALITAWGAQR
jgi:AcrR family transcriptional regulator